MTSPTNARPVPRWLAVSVVVAFFVVQAVLFSVVIFFANANQHLATANDHSNTVSQERHQALQQLSKNNDALRKQVQALGQRPVAPPASDVVETKPGASGTNGVNGRDGIGIDSVTCGSDGAWLVTYTDGRTQSNFGPCIGHDGESVTGPTGAAGADGAAGRDGRDGVDGEPPVSWSLPVLGIDYTCARTDPFDKTAPTYTCTPTTP